MANGMMLDIETLGDEVLVQVAFAVFDLDTYDMLLGRSLPVFADSAGNGRPDTSTVLWWLQQPEATRYKVILDPNCRITLEHALSTLSAAYTGTKCTEIWSHEYDRRLLRAFYKKFDLLGSPPWHYRHERCLRTMLSLNWPLAKRTMDEYQRRPDFIEHEALSDVLEQLACLKAVGLSLRGPAADFPSAVSPETTSAAELS